MKKKKKKNINKCTKQLKKRNIKDLTVNFLNHRPNFYISCFFCAASKSGGRGRGGERGVKGKEGLGKDLAHKRMTFSWGC